MDRQRLKRFLETATNIAVLLVVVAALCTFAISYFVKASSPRLQVGLQRGSLLPQIPGIEYHSSKRTLLITLNTRCLYCHESLPFYRKLIEANARANKELHIVALFPNTAEEVTEFIKGNGLPMEAVPNVQVAELGVSGTPTLILVDSRGEIDDFWIGKLDNLEEEHLIRLHTSESMY